MATLRRGFKADAEVIAVELRGELGLSIFDYLDPFALAAHLGIPIVSLREASKAGLSPKSLVCLASLGQGFDAVTVCVGTVHLIIYNPWQPKTRQANTIAHELSHIVLEHPAGPAIGIGGCRHWDERAEDEAAWQGAALLVPREGAYHWMKQRGTVDGGAIHFGVSKQLFSWRIHGTGIVRQLGHRRAS